MQSIDLNLLRALDALLSEGSVAGAARRLGLSEPATSRALSRLRRATGDPLLVRAGRRLVPTPRALALRSPAREALERAQEVLRPEGAADASRLARTFTIRSGEAFAAVYAAPLLEAARREAPAVVLRFVAEGDEDVEPLRSGMVDLDVGASGSEGPELKAQRLFEEGFVGVTSAGHPLASGKVTVRRFVGHPHVSASRRGKATGPIDEALRELGLSRSVALVVPSFPAAVAAAAGSSSLVAAVPGMLAAREARRLGLFVFPLPVRTPAVEVVQSWHPRFDAEPAHRWLRALIREVVRQGAPPKSPPTS